MGDGGEEASKANSEEVTLQWLLCIINNNKK